MNLAEWGYYVSVSAGAFELFFSYMISTIRSMLVITGILGFLAFFFALSIGLGSRSFQIGGSVLWIRFSLL